MILNTYAVLLAFVALLRVGLGLLVVGLGVAAWRGRGVAVSPEGRESLEDRSYLVFLLALLLLSLNLVSWPLLYLLLQSYVPEWPGVMCIYGVTQIGTDSLGPAHYLPGLLRFLQLTKPALVFLSGAWFVLYLLNRRTATGPLLNRLFVVLLPLGALAAAEASAELAYITIPKREEFPPGGCCVADAGIENASRFLPPVLVGDAGRPWLYAAFYAVNLTLIAALFASTRRKVAPGPWGMAVLLLGGLVVLATSALFLVEVAAPALLHLPDHHCAYDLIPQAPEAVAAVTLFVAGCFFLGWACVARWLGRCRETEPFLGRTVRGLLRWSLAGFVASVAMLSVELAGNGAFSSGDARCELDGLKIEPLYRVRVVDGAGVSHVFCGVRCARRWIDRQGDRPRAVYVTDEASGEEIEAAAAHFVQSGVSTNPITGNHVHAFRDRQRAEEHARAFRGLLLTGADRPFGKEEGGRGKDE
jgi:hypothetical protein